MTEATHWEIGAVKITCIVEVSGILSTGLTAERVKKINDDFFPLRCATRNLGARLECNRQLENDRL
jgi:hypothetical protein